VHSSGDHRDPPPREEHVGLRKHNQEKAYPRVEFSSGVRAEVGLSFVEFLSSIQRRLAILAVSACHVHLLLELDADRVKAEIGRGKRFVSFALRDRLPGRIWARGCGIKVIRDREHQRNTYAYILRHRAEGAWVWKHGDELPSQART
jgi:hypothetical protein